MFLIAFTLASAFRTSTSAILNVTVGENNQLQYVPNEVTASKGDIIQFFLYVWPTLNPLEVSTQVPHTCSVTGNHSVTQSTFENPCAPMKGGIDSEFQVLPVETGEITFYVLHVNDSSSSLWFFCAQTLPAPHCQAGMVFALNPTQNQTFSEFRFRATTSLPGGPTSPMGVQSPTLNVSSSSSGTRTTPTVVISGPPVTSSSTGSPTRSSTTSPDPSSRGGSNARIVIPVSICIGLTVILAATTLLWWRCVRRRHQPAQSIGWTVKTVLHPFFGTPGTGTTNRQTGDVTRLTASKRLTEPSASVPSHPGQSMLQQPRSVLPRQYVKSNRHLIPVEHQDISNVPDQGTATVLPVPALEPPSERGMFITVIHRLEALEATIAQIRQPDPTEALDVTSTSDRPPDYVSQPESEQRRIEGMEQGPMPPLPQKS